MRTGWSGGRTLHRNLIEQQGKGGWANRGDLAMESDGRSATSTYLPAGACGGGRSEEEGGTGEGEEGGDQGTGQEGASAAGHAC